ncbi:MAG: RAD55 family ATPase [Bacteroidota bacterium]
MNSGIQLIKSGFPLIDQKWGGIYKGGGYLIVGPRKSGKTLLSLKLAKESIQQSEKCLFFTTMRPKDLMIQAATIEFDLQKYMNNNSIIVVRVSTPNDIYDDYDQDEYLTEYINDIVSVSEQYEPERIIFDELTPYVGFKRLDLLEDVFTNMLEMIENKNITSFFVVGEPAAEKSKTIVSILSDNVTASIYLEKSEKQIPEQYHSGRIIVNPNVGHTEGQFHSDYWIEPKKGIVVTEELIEEVEAKDVEIIGIQEKEKSYKWSSNISSLANTYNIDDFRLILNNQIALYQTTGQKFGFLSFKLDPKAEINRLITVDMLKNLVSLSVKKRDKLCIIDDKIVILLIRSAEEGVRKMLTKFMENISSIESINLVSLLDHISVANIDVNQSISDSEILFESVINDDNLIFKPFRQYFDT